MSRILFTLIGAIWFMFGVIAFWLMFIKVATAGAVMLGAIYIAVSYMIMIMLAERVK